MERRRFLAGLSSSFTAGFAGCRGFAPPASSSSTPPTTSTNLPRLDTVELPVPRSAIEVRLPRDGIPALVDPAFADDWTDLTVPEQSIGDRGPALPAEAPVVGIERDGDARAYPLRVLDWHEVVNDTFSGPLLVTYCPLCGSSVAAERRVAREETTFGVTGRLWRDDLVLYDRATESWWSQLLATAIRGPRTGDRLSLVPSSLTSWGEWQQLHPNTAVLLPPPHSNTLRGPDATFEYFSPKYPRQREQLIGWTSGDRDRPDPRRLVVGVSANGEARAYPFDVVAEADVVNDRVGGLPVVITVTPGRTLVAYERRLDGRVLEFEPGDDATLRAGGSRWRRADGHATAGPYDGRQLAPAADVPALFWKGWKSFYPDTTVYGS